jgi:hypothetical protein
MTASVTKVILFVPGELGAPWNIAPNLPLPFEEGIPWSHARHKPLYRRAQNMQVWGLPGDRTTKWRDRLPARERRCAPNK